ncbi:MAG TPA: hypothetical protein VHW09_26995 [Bryobacteraceae bacterium]|jgi:hypothetical protein|nr:hypothetical protein [Bryobacteraceae bacterium]
MEMTMYEEAIFGRAAAARPPQPNVIKLAVDAIGREHYRHDWRGHWIWEMGRWTGPLRLEGLMRAANARLKERGEPQITTNPIWEV